MEVIVRVITYVVRRQGVHQKNANAGAKGNFMVYMHEVCLQKLVS
jgi:hypothetical protein